MSRSGNRAQRPRALRKRIREVARVAFTLKQLAWRTTAGWIWIYIIFGLALGQGGRLKGWENSLLWAMNGALVHWGLTPTSPMVFQVCIKLLWLLAICAFSWVQILGFCLYVPFFPLMVLGRVAFRGRLEPYRKIREESFKKARKEGAPPSRRGWGEPLLSLLLIWLILYGRTSAPYPLSVAMLLTGLYFCFRLGRAFSFATPAVTPRWGFTEAMTESARRLVLGTLNNAKSGKITSARDLRFTIWSSSHFLRAFRVASRWMYGKRAHRRAALIVLLGFMFNLATLGGVSILFWAFAIKYAASPSFLALSRASLASAARAIPGLPDPSNLTVPATIQVLDSLAAWAVFVLYAGPVASLFPEFQRRAITRAAENYARIRNARKALYKVTELLRQVQNLLTKHPEVEGFAKNVVLLRKQGDLRPLLLAHPDLVRSLANRPDLVDLYRKLGVSIPDLNELIRQLPPNPIHECATTDTAAASGSDEVSADSATEKTSEPPLAG